MPEARARILALSRERNVVIADRFSLYEEFVKTGKPFHVVTVQPASKREIRLSIELAGKRKLAT